MTRGIGPPRITRAAHYTLGGQRCARGLRMRFLEWDVCTLKQSLPWL